ncbi:MAG: hypothetical protein WB711_03545 [Terriglobales bacterium]
MQFGIALSGDKSGVGSETLFGNTHLRLGIGSQILQPVRGRVLSDQVEASAAIREPDFDLARQTTPAASSGEIEILLAVEATGL